MCEHARHRLRRRGHARPEEARRPAQVVRGPPARAGAQLAAAPLDEAGDLRRRERRPLRPRLEGVPALHLAHPPLPRPRRPPHGARGPLGPASRAATAKAREKLAEAALASSIAERRAMEVERAIVDLYRTFMMKDRRGRALRGDGDGGRRLGRLRAARRAVRRRARAPGGSGRRTATRSTTTASASWHRARATWSRWATG